MSNISKKKLRLFIILFAIIALITTSVFIILKKSNQTQLSSYDNELLRTMSYEQFVDGDEAVDNTDNVKFSSFFLRDLDGDGYAEKIKGTCKQIGTEDTLYMEIIVQTAGYLKDAKIDINGQNFYLETALPKDNELKDNYIGNNIKSIEFEQLNNGTQKLLTGIVKSGDYTHDYTQYDAIGTNINNYSRNDNSIVLTGTYVDGNGTETPITKEINLTTDWYGTTKSCISPNTYFQNRYDLLDRIDEENEKLTLAFNIDTEELKKELNLSSNYVEATIPQLNEYNPISVSLKEGTGETSYDETTRKFTITKNAVTDDNGKITTSLSRKLYNKVEVVYPLEAYTSLENSSLTIKVPISTYYEGYNNPNQEFQNPYKSNVANTTIVANYSRTVGSIANLNIEVGRYISSPDKHYMVSKKKPLRMYNGISEEIDDNYIVKWEAITGRNGASSGIVLKEKKNGEELTADRFINIDSTNDSMETITSNVGIYFNNPVSMLGNNGEIRVYNDETGELIHTFTRLEWYKYNKSNPYMYDTAIKHVRIETSATNLNANLEIYNIKELNDNKILETYTKEEFNKLEYIESNLSMYLGERYIGSKKNQAKYEEPYSLAKISISPKTIATNDIDKKVTITINTIANEENNQEKWKNGTFLIKIPDEIIDIKINEVIINNLEVDSDSNEIIENENGRFIKIQTSNNIPSFYTITINADISPNPRSMTINKKIELYAINEDGVDYLFSKNDEFDIDEDGNQVEKVNYTETDINFVAPNSLLTNQTISEFDNEGTIIVSPKIAELKPVYGEESLEKQRVKIGAELKNNYGNTISEVFMIGKIPFEGNKFALSGKDLYSEFNTAMTNSGILVPTELQGKVDVYYSENENPSRDLLDNSNRWTLGENVQDWTKIKTWAIDFKDTILEKGDDYTFYYIVEIPFGVELNKTSYSHHGIYFCLDTTEGKYRTQTEPNKIGIKLAEKYDLLLTKYQKNVEKLIEGAIYRVSKLDSQGNVVESQTAKTNQQGIIRMTNLYVDNIYEIKEIRSPIDYELNSESVKIIAHVNRQTGELTIEKIDGTTKNDIQVLKNIGENYKAQVNVEDEVKAKLVITKKEVGSDTLISGAKYTIIGEGFLNSGRIIRTNSNGIAMISGLKIGEEYILKETTPAEGYYLNSEEVKFKIRNDNGIYSIDVLEGLPKAYNITQEDDLPIARIEVEDEKIPTYDLEINKMETGTGTDEIPAIPVIGAKFKLYRNNEEKGTYTTDSLGKIIINGLYLFDENKNMDQNYTLKEVFIPEGYTKTKDISFKVQMIDSTLTMITDNMLSYKVENNTIKMKVEDSKSFKLVKKDGETNALLPNVKFALFNEDDGEVPARNSKGDILGTKETINGVEYYTLTTNDRGEITADLPEGIYKAVEVEAANEYDLNGQEKYFGIGRNREGDIRYVPEMVKNIGGTEKDRANNVLATSDGGYIITLNLNSSVEIEGNFYDNPKLIIKYNSSDYIEWIEKIDLENIETIAVTNDEGYLIGGCFTGTDIQIGNQTLSSNGSSDCGIIKLNSEGEIEWATSFGGTDSDLIKSIAVTEDGGFIVGGYFRSSSMQVGDTTLNSNGRDDVFVAKYDSVGEVEWVNSFGGNLDEEIGSIVQISDGSYIVGGSFRSSSIKIGNYTLTNNGEFDGYIAKYNSIGEVEWTSSFGGNEIDEIRSVMATENGDFLLGGSFSSSSIVVDGITLVNHSSMNRSDGFLIKYNSNQEVVWANCIGGNGSEDFYYAKNTLDGGYLVTGTFGSKIDFGNYRIMNSSNVTDAFIIKYNRVDEVEWVGTIPGTNYDFISEADLTTDGKIIAVGGLLSNNIQLNDFYISKKDKAYDKSDALIIKYKPTDKIDIDFENAAIIGAEKDTNISLLDKSLDGGYYVGGFFESSSIQIGENTFTNFNNNNDGVLIKYNNNNNVEWSKSIDGGELTSIKSTSDGGCIVSGTYYIDDFHIGQYNLNNEGNEDTFIAKYDIDGNVEWATSLGKNGHDFIYSIAETNDGGFVLGGCFDSENLTIGQFSFNNIQGNNHSDALIVKVNSQGVVEWATAISGNDEDSIKNVIATKDGGYLVQGKYNSGIIQIGDELFTNVDNEIESFIIKFNSDNEVEWAKNIPAVIEAVSQSSDEGIFLAGSFNSSNIQIGEFKFYNKRGNEFPKKNDGLIIKYTIDGYLEWAKSIASELDDIIYSIWNTEDGGFIIGGSFNSYGILIGPDAVYPKNALEYDGIIVKYDNKGKPEWASNVGDTKLDEIKAVIETTNKKYIALGSFESDTIKVGNYTLTNTGAKDAMILNINTVFNVKEQEEIVFENQIKRYKITTDVKEINGNKGGMISGEDNAPYESVKYGENSTKIVKMIPDENYEIIGITINGKEYPYIPLPDGSYQMPQFENMTEDKHIEVAFSLKDNKITINKIDKNTGEKLSNADFKLEQIDERTEPISNDVIGDLTDNGKMYYVLNDNSNEVTDTVLGNLTYGGSYAFIKRDNKLIPTNSKSFQLEYDPNAIGIPNTIAKSYMKVDLRGLEGKYVVLINARISSESSSDYGYATITNGTSSPSYDDSNGRFMYISGNVENKDYQSNTLNGGKAYYLHLGYRKDNANDVGEDWIVINSIKVFKLEETYFNFINNNGVFESSNAGQDSTVCNSYIPIDLTNYSGKYNITVNAEISTMFDSNGDCGFVTISNSKSAPGYSSTLGRIVLISNITKAKDYTYEVVGGKQYYLHLGYYKDKTPNTSGNDIFKVNSVNVSLSNSELCNVSIKTNSEGQAITQIPFGKYLLTEVNAPTGYKGLEQPMEIEFRGTAGAQHEFTIENEKLSKVIVHHYIKGTTTKLAEDEEYYGAIDEDYTTSPKLDIERYSLEKDGDNKYVLPTNATGKYIAEDTIVNYYYVPMPATVRVNHYIEGTENPVPLVDGNEAPREIKNGEPGENYTTSAITPENLDQRYELVEVPENSTGIYTEEEIIVNYFYKLKSYKITTEVEEYDQTNILGDTEHIRGGDILGEKANPYETVKHSENSKKDIIVTPEQGYEVQNLTINGDVEPFVAEPDGKVELDKFTNVTEDKHVVVRLGKKLSSVLVHHYIEGTTTRVPSKYGGEVQDQTTTGAIGNPYITNPTDELTDRYELVTMPGNASGLFAENQIEVIYYYREVPAKVIVNHYIENTTNPVPLNNGGTASQEIINGYVTKPYTTNRLTNISDEYEYVSNTGNTSGQMTKADIIVNYYYAPKAKAYAKVNYIAINSDNTETTLETIDYEGEDGEEYTAHAKDFTGYELVQRPDIETKNLDKNQITIFNYYYRQYTGILEKHIDLYSGDILFNDSQDGSVGDQYEIDSKTFDGYDIATNKKYYEKQIKDDPSILSNNGVDSLEGLLNKLNLEPNDPYIPDNYKGIMRESTIEVKYYYMKKAKVIVQYKDKLTDEPIHPDTPIDGHEKDPYSTTPENIDGYDLTNDPDYTPNNTEGEMTPDTITVTYYYEQKAEVEVNHIYIVDESLIENGKMEGHVKDLYKTNPLDSEQYPNYRLVTNKEYYDYAIEKDSSILSDNGVTTVGELLAKLKLSEYDPYIPTNSKGEMTKNKIIVNYYYKKQAKIIVKHIDEETGKELIDPEEETKDLGDPYSTEPETIEKYEVVNDKLPENADGIVDEDGEEVIYYYRKVKKTIIPTANSGDTDEKQNKGEKVMSPQTGDTTLIVAIGMLLAFIVMNVLQKTNMNKKGTKPTSVIK